MNEPQKPKENFFVKARRRALQRHKETIREFGDKGVSHRKILALIKMDGASEKTALDYLKTLENAGFIRYDPTEKKTDGTWFIIDA